MKMFVEVKNKKVDVKKGTKVLGDIMKENTNKLLTKLKVPLSSLSLLINHISTLLPF